VGNSCQITPSSLVTPLVILKEVQQLEGIIKIQLSKDKPFSTKEGVLLIKLVSIAIDKRMGLPLESL
jgi:hypothetical protein